MADIHNVNFILTFFAKLYCSVWSVTTDRCPQFELTLFFKTCDFLDCEYIRPTAYYPAPNRVVERLHQQLKAALMSHSDRGHWVDSLSNFLSDIRSFFKPNSNACADELVYGSTLRLSGYFLEHTRPSTPDDVCD